MRRLTDKQKLFVEFYLANPNATEAASKAGYSKKTAYSSGQRLLKDVEIAALVGQRLDNAAMSADEVLRRLTEHARASLFDLVDVNGNLDLQMAREAGKDHLVKKFKVNYTKEGMTREYEIHDPQAALVHLGKYHKLFTDKLEASGPNGGPVQTQFIIEVVTKADDGNGNTTDADKD